MGISRRRRGLITSRASPFVGQATRELTSPCDSHQVINNACASIAILNATFNIQDPNVKLGEELENLRSFSEGGQPVGGTPQEAEG